MIAALWANVKAYFATRPILGPGLRAEFTVTIDDHFYVRLYDWNHAGLSDALLAQAMCDALVTSLQKKGANREGVMKYIESRWAKNVADGKV